VDTWPALITTLYALVTQLKSVNKVEPWTPSAGEGKWQSGKLNTSDLRGPTRTQMRVAITDMRSTSAAVFVVV
jgi:hypothetical protein